MPSERATVSRALQTVAGVEPRGLELRIGPLEQGRGQRLVADSSLDGLGSVIAKLVDGFQVESAGSYEVLALRLTDERGEGGGDARDEARGR